MARIHFLNVGHGDCTIIEHNNRNLTMIDMNNGSELDEESTKSILESLSADRRQYLNRVIAGQYGLQSWQTLLSEAGYDIELANPFEFLNAEYPERPLFRYIQTHPDLDHMGGLAALESSGREVLNFWDTQNTREWDEERDREDKLEDWEAYQRFRSGQNCKVLHLYRDAKGKYWNQG
jgi:beta-lactamase superfamily II metal-dependent hydrolase